MLNEMTPAPFLYKPAQNGTTPFVFAVPHSGRHYPADFVKRSSLSTNDLRQSEDAFVDKLYSDIPSHAAALLVATHARAYLDLNRAEDELDPGMFTPALDKSKLNVSYRVEAGLGAIPKYVSENTPIYDSFLPAREAEKRINSIHKPYHLKLTSLLQKRVEEFGIAFLIDCHSMPSEPYVKSEKSSHPNIVLGDCWGNSCMRDLTDIAETLFLKEGFNVRRNVPYSGGYSTSKYGASQGSIHALQIEISRNLYMDEETLTPRPEFHEIQETISIIAQNLIGEVMRRTRDHDLLAQAAE